MPAFDFSGYSTKNYSSPTTTSNTGNSNRENARTTQYSSQPKTKSTFKTAKTSFDDAAGKSKLDNYQVPKTGSLVLNSFQKARQKMFETNRKFFQEKVLTSKNRGNYENTFDSYSSYIDSRMSGKTDAYGNTIYSNSNNDNPINKATKTAPTEAEVSQSEAANADTEANRLLKIKKRGRSQSIISGSQGVTKMAADYSLGKKSLLGRV